MRKPTMMVFGAAFALSASAATSHADGRDGAQDLDGFTQRTAVAERDLARVRGFGAEAAREILTTVEPGSRANVARDAFSSFAGVAHVIQNNASGASISVDTDIRVQPADPE